MVGEMGHTKGMTTAYEYDTDFDPQPADQDDEINCPQCHSTDVEPDIDWLDEAWTQPAPDDHGYCHRCDITFPQHP